MKYFKYLEWTDIKTEQNNMLQFGVLDPSREDRRKLKRKVHYKDESNESTLEPSKKKIKNTMHHDDDLFKNIMMQKSKAEV